MAEPRDEKWPHIEYTADQKAIEKAWRDAGLPEWFLGNGGTNHGLYAFAAALRSPGLDRDGERMRAEGAEIEPAWPALCHMRLALSNERGMRLSLRDLERLHASPVGRLMDAAAEYGTSTTGAVPDPVLLIGAVVVPATGSTLPLAHEEKAGC